MKYLRLVSLASLGLALFPALAPTAHGGVFDFVEDFSIANGNPNGAWSYGLASTDFSTFTLFDHTTTAVNELAPSITWHMENTAAGGIWKNLSPISGYSVAPGEVSLHPSFDLSPAVARWTAPVGTSGSAAIQGVFGAGDLGTMSVAVRYNGIELWSAVDSGTFNLNVPVSAGDTVDFAVFNGYGFGNTPLAATINVVTAVPEPSSVAFVTGASLLVVALRRRGKTP